MKLYDLMEQDMNEGKEMAKKFYQKMKTGFLKIRMNPNSPASHEKKYVKIKWELPDKYNLKENIFLHGTTYVFTPKKGEVITMYVDENESETKEFLYHLQDIRQGLNDHIYRKFLQTGVYDIDLIFLPKVVIVKNLFGQVKKVS